MKSLSSIIRSLILRVATALRMPLGWIENAIYQDDRERVEKAPVFIIGSPRSGSTILYQMLTHSLQCVYIDNLAYCFYNNLPLGIWISKVLFKQKSHMSFSSNHGITIGLHAPSECTGYWRRWFGKENDYVSVNQETETLCGQLKSDFDKIYNKFDTNFIIKNLGNSQRISILQKCFPNAKFIYIQREPRYTVESLLKARLKDNIDDSKWWSVKPSNYRELSQLPLTQKLVAQVYYNELQIVNDLEGLCDSQKLIVAYEEIPNRYDEILKFTNCEVIRELPESIFNFEYKSADKGNSEEIKEEIAKYSWQHMGYSGV